MPAIDQLHGWTPIGTPSRPLVLHKESAAALDPARAQDWLAGLTDGLTETFTDVLPLDLTQETAGAIRTLHLATGPNGEGLAVETLLRSGRDVLCWISPVAHYLTDLDRAHRTMRLGRPSRSVDQEPTALPPGIAVAQASLRIHRGSPSGTGVIQRRGPVAYAELPGLDAPVLLPASLVPAWLLALTGAGPRPQASSGRMVLTAASALERLLGLVSAVDDDVRAALDAPELPASDAQALADLINGLTRYWILDWAFGRLEVLDGGAAGLWRVLSDLPEVLTAELDAPPGADPIGLIRTTTSALFRELALLSSD